MKRSGTVLLATLGIAAAVTAADITVVYNKGPVKAPAPGVHYQYRFVLRKNWLQNRSSDFERKVAPLANLDGYHLDANIPSFLVHIHGQIDLLDSVKLKQALRKLKVTPGATVHVTISSPGGVYFEGVRIYNQLRSFAKKKRVTIATSAVARGAHSAGAVIWAAGDIQMIGRGSSVGFHAPYSPKDLRQAKKLTVEMKQTIRRSLSERKGYPMTNNKAGDPIDMGETASDICDYIDLVFSQKGAYAVIAIKDDGDLDLFDSKKAKKNARDYRWAYPMTSVFMSAMVIGDDKYVQHKNGRWVAGRGINVSSRPKGDADISYLGQSCSAAFVSVRRGVPNGRYMNYRVYYHALMLFDWKDGHLVAPFNSFASRAERVWGSRPWDSERDLREPRAFVQQGLKGYVTR